MRREHYDVAILGAGLAGLCLARQILLNSDKTVLLLEKRTHIPPRRQKVGEATVQVSGYYLSKVLDLEEHLLREHLLKYNLRFYWKTAGRRNDCFEDYSQAYIRGLSNIATYQLDRNKIEAELVRLNCQNPRFTLRTGALNLDVRLSNSEEAHGLSFESGGQRFEAEACWVVDTTGRAKFLSRRLGLAKPSPIRHGSTFFWVDGLVNVEKLTGLSHGQRLKHPSRRAIGHFPFWLSTNHFCGEGYWFWVIPLQGKTSLGLVYDKSVIPETEVSSPEKVIEWICREFPLFARDLPARTIVDRGIFRDFAYDCRQTISIDRWALSGESGRFTDPLYSPGGDLISLYNTLITDAIVTRDPTALGIKVRVYELMMWAFYEAYVPSYAVSYEVLGDQECYAMKYAWELTIYFAFYVFPFINQVFTEVGFAVPYLDLLAKLGVVNQKIQTFIRDFYRWKKKQPAEPHNPNFVDFTFFEPLKKSEELFYEVGCTSSESLVLLRQHLASIEKLARFIAVYIYSVVLDDASLLTNKQLAETLKVEELHFDPEGMRQACNVLGQEVDARLLKLAPKFVNRFRRSQKSQKPGPPAIVRTAPIPITASAMRQGR